VILNTETKSIITPAKIVISGIKNIFPVPASTKERSIQDNAPAGP
jgi:hypothetical protein